MFSLPKFRMFRIFLNINSISYSFRSIANQNGVRYSYSTSYFKKYSVQNVNKPFVYITDLTSTLIIVFMHTKKPNMVNYTTGIYNNKYNCTSQGVKTGLSKKYCG